MRYFLYILLLASQFMFAQNFDKANELYRSEKYDAAAQEYEKIIASGKESSELYFNLANSYYKLAKVGPSIYYYEKALLLNPNDAEIQNNLKFAQKMQIDDVKEFQVSGIKSLVTNFSSAFHYNTWAWIIIVSAFLFFACFAVYYFTSNTLLKRIFFIIMLLLLLNMVLSVSAALYQKSIVDNQRPAIVYVAIADVKAEPKENSTNAFVLHEGTKVYITESLDQWRKIILADGHDGWIEAKYLRELK